MLTTQIRFEAKAVTPLRDVSIATSYRFPCAAPITKRRLVEKSSPDTFSHAFMHLAGYFFLLIVSITSVPPPPCSMTLGALSVIFLESIPGRLKKKSKGKRSRSKKKRYQENQNGNSTKKKATPTSENAYINL